MNKKITTPEQFEKLVCFMEKHSDLVTGAFSKMGAKKNSSELWEDLKICLNSIGPPVRDEEGWKKVRL